MLLAVICLEGLQHIVFQLVQAPSIFHELAIHFKVLFLSLQTVRIAQHFVAPDKLQVKRRYISRLSFGDSASSLIDSKRC